MLCFVINSIVFVGILIFPLPSLGKPRCSDEYALLSTKGGDQNNSSDSSTVVSRANMKDQFYLITNRGITNGNFEEPLLNIYGPTLLNVDELKGTKVLDAGTGRGLFVKELDAHGVDAIGIDLVLSPEQVADPRLFKKADMLRTGFADGSFDYIYSTWSLFSYELNKSPELLQRALREFHRICKSKCKVRLGPFDVGARENLENLFTNVAEFKATIYENTFRIPNTYPGYKTNLVVELEKLP